MGVCATIAEYVAYVATDKRKEMNNMVLRERGGSSHYVLLFY